MNLIRLLLIVPILLFGTFTGCGGGQKDSAGLPAGRGAITVTIRWPESRAIPVDTRSIKLSAKVLEPENGPVVKELVVARPEGQTISNATLSPVPSVKVRVTASAHRTTDGTGEILSQASVEVQVAENRTVTANIELGLIARIEIQPATAQVDVGATLPLSARAFDAQGNEVAVPATDWQWSIVPTTIATITPSGASAVVRGVSPGAAAASVVLTSAGLSASRSVAVGVLLQIAGTYQGSGRVVTPNGFSRPIPASFVVTQSDDQATIVVTLAEDNEFGITGPRQIRGTLLARPDEKDMVILSPDGSQLARFHFFNGLQNRAFQATGRVIVEPRTPPDFFRFEFEFLRSP